MTSTAVLRTPPASASCRSDYIPLRRPRGIKDKGLGRDNTPSPTTSVIGYRVKSPSDRTFGDSPTQPSPSPLRKRVLFERGSSGQRDDDDDDEALPSTMRLHSPFASHCASPFLRAWGGHGSKISSTKPVEDDEGLFLASKVTTTPTRTSSQPMSRGPSRSSHTPAVNARNSEIPTLILTPSAPKRLPLPVLQPPSLPTRTPQTPAETDWHLGRQTESMTKLSLHDDVEYGAGRHKTNGRLGFIDKEEELSPSLVPKRRGRKRSLEGNELPRCKGGIFETAADTPLMTSFHIPESPSPLTRHKASATEFFGPAIQPSPGLCAKPSQLSVMTSVSATAQSRSSSPKPSFGAIAKKYRPRDSGVAGIEDEDETEDGLGPLAPTRAVVPEEEASGLVTPGVEPPTRSAWPRAGFGQGQQGNVDEFIFKALAAPPREKKVMPSTPVKRNAFALSRPWMSSSKVMPPPAMPRAGGVPRKSLPLSFPDLSQIQTSPDASEISPSDRPLTQRKTHGEIGKGRPPMLLSRGAGDNANAKTRFLMRRSSSGAFSSSSSESSFLGTPTKFVPPSMPSPSKTHSTTQSRGRRVEYRLPGLSTKKPSSSQIAGMTPIRRPAFGCHDTRDNYGSSPQSSSFSLPPRPLTEYECAGKFEADFVTIDNLGTGEFGNVLKVQNKRGDEKDVFAIKKSKRFEGIKHRRRLREEVDVLKHLALIGGSQNHPNILRYVDSWEQDDILYIQTELCELGNFGTFLAEYGMNFEALDEARVWKICAELSSGINYIHSAGVIHLDLKPDNIFITGEGRFRIGDFGMASLWPRRASDDGFEREGDREYMAPEVLQGRYGKEADVFSFGMIMLETAANIVVPDMGDDWHRLREDDFSAVDFSSGALARPRSEELVQLLSLMMRSDPDARLGIDGVYSNTIVQRARDSMAQKLLVAAQEGMPVFTASPLGGEPDGYLDDMLLLRPNSELAMDLSP